MKLKYYGYIMAIATAIVYILAFIMTLWPMMINCDNLPHSQI